MHGLTITWHTEFIAPPVNRNTSMNVIPPPPTHTHTACDLGFYASAANGECLTCPSNSDSTASGLTECPCDDGYYRTPQEVDFPCTCELEDNAILSFG